LTENGRPLIACSYDGASIYTLESTDEGAQVTAQPVAAGFQPPTRLSELLGIAAALQLTSGEGDAGRFILKANGSLPDGSPAWRVRVNPPGSTAASDEYSMASIRPDDRSIALVEGFQQEQKLIEARRVEVEAAAHVASDAVWDLSDLPLDKPVPEPFRVALESAAVIPGVTVQQMIDRLDFPTYIFASYPSWAPERMIIDVKDSTSETGERMFAVLYRAEDHRHVVLMQAAAYNRMMGQMVKAAEANVVFEAPNGFKLWFVPEGKRGAHIAFSSVRAVLKESASPDAVGYVLESPAGTYPGLVINGRVSVEELKELVNSLVPAG
jgi:hypothetical protein